jgi:hypothetical protein
MYAEAGQHERAVAAFKDLVKKADEKAPGYQRLPREAVQRRIEGLEKRQ